MGSLGNLIQVPSQDSDSEGGASGRHRGVSPSVKGKMEWTVAILGRRLCLGLCDTMGGLGRKEHFPAISGWPTLTTRT